MKLTTCVGGLRSLLGPLCAVLGRSWGQRWRSGGGLGSYVGDLGQLLGLYGRSWAALDVSIGGFGCTWAVLGTYVDDLGRLWGRSWTDLGAFGSPSWEPNMRSGSSGCSIW